MKKRISYAFPLMFLVLFFGCSQKQRTSNNLSVNVPVDKTVTAGTVELTCNSLHFTKPIKLEANQAVVLFKKIPAGEWSISVVLFNSAGEPVYAGTGEAGVDKDEETTADIVLKKIEDNGDLKVTVSLPRETSRQPSSHEAETAEPRRKGLTLWNTLDSVDDIQHSRIGPDGNVIQPVYFLPAKFGNGVQNDAGGGRPCFPPEAIKNKDAGCIEFWVKSGQDRTHEGKHNYYFDSFDESKRLGFQSGAQKDNSVYFVLFHQAEEAVQLNEKNPPVREAGRFTHVAVV